MRLIQRIGYYLGGLSIGLIILAFFFNAKRTSCSYGPQARVLKNINSKNIKYSEGIPPGDSAIVQQVLQNGHVNFSKSSPRKEPCGHYVVEAIQEGQSRSVTLKNCDSIVVIESLEK